MRLAAAPAVQIVAPESAARIGIAIPCTAAYRWKLKKMKKKSATNQELTFPATTVSTLAYC